MASIKKIVLPPREENGRPVPEARRTRYRLSWRDAAGTQRRQTLRDMKSAEALRTQVEAERLAGVVPLRRRRVTVAEAYEEWLASRHLRPQSREVMHRRWALYLEAEWGDVAVADVGRHDLQTFTVELGDRLAPRTVKATMAILRAVLTWCSDEGLVDKNPAVRLQMPALPSNRIRLLTTDEVARFAAAMPPRLRALVWFMASTGCRPGEAAGLINDRLDLDSGVVHIDQQLVTVGGSDWRIAPPKTAKSVRSIPLGQSTVELMRSHLEAFPPATLDLVFTNHAGSPLVRQKAAMIVRRARDHAGLPVGLRLHDLRHYSASLLIAAGLSPVAVARRLGHSSPTETLRTYASLWPTDDERCVAIVEGELAGPMLTNR